MTKIALGTWAWGADAFGGGHRVWEQNVSQRRTRPRTLQGDDPMEECPMAVRNVADTTCSKNN